MKKLFTLLVVSLLVSINAMAKKVIENPTFSPWDAKTCTISGGTLTFTAAWAGAGLNLLTSNDDGTQKPTDYSDYDYIVIKLSNVTCAFNAAIEYANTSGVIDKTLGSSTVSGNAGDLIIGVPLGDHSDVVGQIWLQAKAAGSLTVDEMYLGSKEEYEADKDANKPQTSDLSLTDLGSGWGEGTSYDAATKTITIGAKADWSGKGWWLSDVDYSDFDNLVIEFDPATTANGKIVIEYVDNTNNGDEGLFDAGTTVKVCALSSSKNHVKQIYIQGPAGSTYTLKSAYLATTASTPTGISNVSAKTENANAAVYNMAGQRVSNSYKGLIIKNGKKMIVK